MFIRITYIHIYMHTCMYTFPNKNKTGHIPFTFDFVRVKSYEGIETHTHTNAYTHTHILTLLNLYVLPSQYILIMNASI